MPESRPDPDQLLARLKEEEAQSQRGKLKIFFGASAGVGKTYAMLAAAHLLRQQGSDVVIGVVETHGRIETDAMTRGLTIVPRREIPYEGRALTEMVEPDGEYLAAFSRSCPSDSSISPESTLTSGRSSANSISTL